MKITNIESQKNKDRVNIYIDGSFAFGLSEELRYKYGLSIDMDVDTNFIENILKLEEKHKAISYALSFLSYRQRSEKELYLKLRKKGFEDIYREESIKYCRENNYIDDRVFAESFIKDKTNLNKYGPKRIEYELISKGVSKDIIHEILDIDKDYEYEVAMDLALKKYSSYKKDDKNSIYRKLSGFLQRKGYSYDVVSKVLKDINTKHNL